MNRIYLFLLPLLLVSNLFLSAQTYSILIKGGHVIDPKNNIDGVMDIAISEGKIVKVEKDINAKATQVVNAKGLYVVPGLIDIHTHNFVGTNGDQQYMNGPAGVIPDGFTFRSGVTTVVDAGSSGWRTFPDFKRNIIDRSQTRVLAFLNIVGEGMRGGVYAAVTKALANRVKLWVTRRRPSIFPQSPGIKLALASIPDIDSR